MIWSFSIGQKINSVTSNLTFRGESLTTAMPKECGSGILYFNLEGNQTSFCMNRFID